MLKKRNGNSNKEPKGSARDQKHCEKNEDCIIGIEVD
jgi:hypothetical protein